MRKGGPTFIWFKSIDSLQNLYANNPISHISFGNIKDNNKLLFFAEWLYNKADEISPPPYWQFRGLPEGTIASIRRVLRAAHEKHMAHFDALALEEGELDDSTIFGS